MRRSSFVLPLLFVATLGGCSSETADLFKTGATGSGGAGGAGVTASTKSATSTSTNPPDTTGVTSAVSTTGSTNPDTVASSSGGPVQTVQASSSSGPLGDFVDCGNAGPCEVDDSNVCCWHDDDESGQCAPADSCALTATGQFLTAISCQSPLDCPGQICCGHRYFGDGGQVYEKTSCTNTCQTPDVQLCDQNVPNICPFYTEMGQQKQMVCKSSTLLPPGYFVCGKPNP